MRKMLEILLLRHERGLHMPLRETALALLGKLTEEQVKFVVTILITTLKS